MRLHLSIAHYEAATKPENPRLHRDISSGNILIYPRITKTVTGRRFIQWKGLLADWEMSKPICKGDEVRQPRQPERTVSMSYFADQRTRSCAYLQGTWQYTSVALLSPG